VPAQAPLGRLLLDFALFGLSGIVLLIIGYYLWEMITPYNLRREIHENKNLAVAIVAGAFVIGMGIVIAAAIATVRCRRVVKRPAGDPQAAIDSGRARRIQSKGPVISRVSPCSS
jgi:putative membrane protein